MQARLKHLLVHEPGSWQETLLACLPFLLPCFLLGIFSLRGVGFCLPAPLGLGLLGLAALFLALLGIAGLGVGLPRWSMPYAGLLVSGVVFVALAPALLALFYGRSSVPWWLRMLLLEAVYLFVLLALTFLLVWLASKTPLTLAFCTQLHKDRSLASLAMYGGGVVWILGMYEEFPHAGVYILLTIIPLIFGVWLYLHSRSGSWRLAALSLGFTLAMGVALIAHGHLVDWDSPVVFQAGGLVITRAVLSLLLVWLLGLAMLFVSFLLPLTPWNKASAMVPETNNGHQQDDRWHSLRM